MAAPDVPPVDQGNSLLGETPAMLTCSLGENVAGQRLVLTIRTPSTTVTLLLSRDDAQAWARQIKAVADQMSGSGLIVAGTAALNGGAKAGAP